MSLIHHQIITQSKPLPPILCLPEAKEVIPPLEKFTSSVDTWLDHGAPDRLRLEGICFEEFERVLKYLYSRGLKPRYDWDQESRTAVLRMPKEYHEVVGVFVARKVVDVINQFLEEFSICGNPSVDAMGSLDLRIGEGGSVVVPDQCLCLMQPNAHGRRVRVEKTPRIIVETSTSESRRHVMAKALWCLHEMPGLHAVIVCDMRSAPPSTVQDAKSGPKRAKPFKAEIAVWTRKPTGPFDADQLLDPCYHLEELGEHKLGGGACISGFEQNLRGASSPVRGSGFNPSASAYFRSDPKDSNRQQYIFRRSKKWIVVYDESIPTVPGQQEPVLLLNAYDVLRPCSRFPHEYLSNQSISIPLGDLRDTLISLLEESRGPSGQGSAPPAGSSTHGLDPSQDSRTKQGQPQSTTAPLTNSASLSSLRPGSKSTIEHGLYAGTSRLVVPSTKSRIKSLVCSKSLSLAAPFIPSSNSHFCSLVNNKSFTSRSSRNIPFLPIYPIESNFRHNLPTSVTSPLLGIRSTRSWTTSKPVGARTFSSAAKVSRFTTHLGVHSRACMLALTSVWGSFMFKRPNAEHSGGSYYCL